MLPVVVHKDYNYIMYINWLLINMNMMIAPMMSPIAMFLSLSEMRGATNLMKKW
jgi:hypothetical protein